MKSFEKKKNIKPVKTEQQQYSVFFAKLNTPVVFGLFIFILLFFYLQKQLAFHFYYIEQEQLFLWSRAYFLSFIIKPAGLLQWLTEFCVQHFIQPYLGALIMSVILTAISILAAGIIKRIASTANLHILSLLPIVFLLYMHFDINYLYEGTVAYLLMLLVMYGYFCIGNFLPRIIYVTVSGILLFWCAGPVAFLFTVCVFLWEILNRFSKAFVFILPILLVAALAFVGVYTSLADNYRLLLLPDGYYTRQLHPGTEIYLSWVVLPVILLLCRLFSKRQHTGRKRKYAEYLLQLMSVAVLFGFTIEKFTDRSYDFFKEFNYYTRNGQWDKIIERCDEGVNNYLHLNFLNMALIEKGELAEKMFSFPQGGLQGLTVTWNMMPHISALQSDIYFSIGHIALAQRMAFEANVSMQNSNGAMLKRLVQTNLIYGAYPVAEKYIDLLEQTKYYSEWAHEHRRFLWNDYAVENDALLGMKRKCIPVSNTLIEEQNIHIDMEYIAIQNPAHQASIQYVGALFLLTKDILLFRELLEKHYGTDVLPTLPKSYQEAIIIVTEQDPSKWEQFNISEQVIQRYNEYKKQVLDNRGNAALPNLLKASFSDTYWYYYMFYKL
ncbi:MAG: DUF6057 family protein [Bacteroidales bacterium]|jgi:hypothetical protein|nr:DUF6057 family protein [Bacteroidales bacterium]